MIVRCPAKINLSFEILGRREDGYHDIHSVMQTIEIYDYLAVDRFESYRYTGAFICPMKELLITKAVKALEETVGHPLPCMVHLDKTIPIGAGLGGGSSDAAGTLMALNQLYQLHLSKPDLAEIGVRVGADVPFFIYGGKCEVEGMGERVTPLPSDEGDIYYLVFRPHNRLSTREAYQWWDRTGGLHSVAQMARERCPQLETIFSLFPDATVSGKGPSVFVTVTEPGIRALHRTKEPWNGDIFIARPCEGIAWEASFAKSVPHRR